MKRRHLPPRTLVSLLIYYFGIGLAPATEGAAGAAKKNLAGTITIAGETCVDECNGALDGPAAQAGAHVLVVKIRGEINHVCSLFDSKRECDWPII